VEACLGIATAVRGLLTAATSVSVVSVMEQRSFGDGVPVSVLGIGCSRVGSISNPVPMREVEATLETAVESGINLFDTADIYGQGDSERALSRLLHRHGDRVFVMTKVGGRHSRYASALRIAKPFLRMLARSQPLVSSTMVHVRTASVSHNFHTPDLLRAVEGSRRRLRLERLDGLLLHNPLLETLRDPEIHDFLAQVLHNGQAACVGASVESLPEVEAVLSMPVPVTILQVPAALANTLSGTTIVEHIRQRNIGVFVHAILSGRTTSKQSPREAISAAIAPDFVTAATVGVSSRHHLYELLSAVP
jgi:aryl-alcohol dehydrogenase-like predicted oxidoreductase